MEWLLGFINLEKIGEFLANNGLLIIWLAALVIFIFLVIDYFFRSEPEPKGSEDQEPKGSEDQGLEELRKLLEESLGKPLKNPELVKIIRVVTQKIISEVTSSLKNELLPFSMNKDQIIEKINQLIDTLRKTDQKFLDSFTGFNKNINDALIVLKLILKKNKEIQEQGNELLALTTKLPENLKIVLTAEFEEVLEDLINKITTTLKEEKKEIPRDRIKREIERSGVPLETQEVIEEAIEGEEQTDPESALELSEEEIRALQNITPPPKGGKK